MSNFEYILFDLDGTLIDSKRGIVKCIRYALDKKNIPYTDDLLDKMIGPSFRVSMHDFLGLEMPIIEQLISLYRGIYEVEGWKNCALYEGVENMLKTLHGEGKRLAVATSKPIKFTNMIVDGFNLRQYFDFVGGASSDASREAKCDVIQACLDSLNVDDRSKVLMVGDRLYDIEGAHQCGVKCAAILYGYGNLEEFEEYKADYVLPMPNDVVQLVLGK